MIEDSLDSGVQLAIAIADRAAAPPHEHSSVVEQQGNRQCRDAERTRCSVFAIDPEIHRELATLRDIVAEIEGDTANLRRKLRGSL